MATEAGIKMQKAINAVCRMHASASKLLVEFDKAVPWPSVSVMGTTATRDISRQTKAGFWMAEGVFRYLGSTTDLGLVEAVCVPFVSPQLQEPMLLLGHLRYRAKSIDDLKSVCEGWDLWYMYFDSKKEWVEGVPRVCEIPSKNADRIARAKLVAVPLYSITAMNDVAELLRPLRQ
jgi:hypothetical protein